MQYKKILLGETCIEFHNNWLGEETVIVNGHTVSKRSSIMGTNHFFTLLENGHMVRYVLTSKLDTNFQLKLDLSKNGKPLKKNISVYFGSKPENKAKKTGIAKLKNFEIAEALDDFEKALVMYPKDPEIFFHMACAYSVLEDLEKGMDCLKKSVAHGLQNHEAIFNHPMLAFLRMDNSFEGLANNGFKDDTDS